MSQYTPEQEKEFAEVSRVQAKYAHDLMAYANVVGIGIGIAKKNGNYTNHVALVVMVSEKLPVAQLAEDDVLPDKIEGVRVDVQATGGFSANDDVVGGFST